MRRIALASTLALTACGTDAPPEAEPCGGHGAVHGDRCRCDPGRCVPA